MSTSPDESLLDIRDHKALQSWADRQGFSVASVMEAIEAVGPSQERVANFLVHRSRGGYEDELPNAKRAFGSSAEAPLDHTMPSLGEDLDNGAGDPIRRAAGYSTRGMLDEAKNELTNALIDDPSNEALRERLDEVVQTMIDREAAADAGASDGAPLHIVGSRASQGFTRNEQVAQEDALKREKITRALVQLITQRTNVMPFAIGLFGHWGSGKSSQIQFVAKLLKQSQEPTIRVVEFNAWEHENCDNMGAAIAQAVVDALVSELGFFRRCTLAFSLARLRNAPRKAALDKDRLAIDIWFRQMAGAAVPWLVVASALAIPAFIFVSNSISTLKAGIAVGVPSVVGICAAINHYVAKNLTNWFKSINTEANRKVFQMPDFTAKLGSFHEIHTTLKLLCALRLAGTATEPGMGDYLLLVVDDLDRCSPEAVKKVFDAVRLVANVPRVVTLVALDERIAFAAVEKHFNQFDGSGREPVQVARDYLAKVFQVAISLPPVEQPTSSAFIRTQLFVGSHRKAQASDEPPHAAPAVPEAQAALVRAATAASTVEEFYDVLEEEIELFATLASATEMVNPRQLWRLKQAWFILKGLVLTDGDDLEMMSPWLHALFSREWILQASPELRKEIDGTIGNGGDFPLPSRLPEAVFALLSKEKQGASVRWPIVDSVLLPAGIGRSAATAA